MMNNAKYHSFEKLERNNKEFLLNKELTKAIEINDGKKVKVLLKAGATLHKLTGLHLHSYNSQYETLLHIATKRGHHELVTFLIDLGCNVNAVTRSNIASPLHYATYKTVSINIIETLLKHGANIEAEDSDKATPLMWAAFLNNSEAIVTLLKHSAKTLKKDTFGLSELGWASRQGNIEATTALINNARYSQEQIKDAIDEAIDNGQESTAIFLNASLT